MKSFSMTPTENPTLLRDALNLSGNGIMLFECLRTSTGSVLDFRLILANNIAEEIVDKREQEMLGQSVSDLFPQLTELAQQAQQVVITGKSFKTELKFLLPNNTAENWFAILCQKHGDGIAISFSDVTDRKRYEQDSKKIIDGLKLSNENLERFAYITSHDLQEPLRKIVSFGDMLRNQSDSLDEYSNSLVSRIQSAAGRMNTLIHDLLAFARLSSEKRVLQATNLQEVFDDVLLDLETTIRDKKALIDVTTLPTVQGDVLQLRQLFLNLLSNALKFNSPGRQPIIRIDCQQLTGRDIAALPDQQIEEADWDRSFYAISVVDNGIGFDEKYLDRIFTVFQRLHTRSEYQGTGIGLTIVQKVVENHGGYIGAHSQPHNGATFTVYLPADADPLAAIRL